ncbi:MAG: fructose-1,6-bisphosphatase [Campylobacterales bacterium]|nr:fructose-1,6-bisphosphatase [Campylobacterales bacterium]
MIEVFNAVLNIAVAIERDVFKNCTDFLKDDSDEDIHRKVYAHCTAIIENEFEKVRTIKGAISKDKKQFCLINEDGKYILSYVSIDNIDLLDVDFSLGSMFAVYEDEIDAKSLKAAIYVTYGPTFQLVFASKSEGVKFFSYSNHELVQEESFMLESKGKINSPSGIQCQWSDLHRDLIESFFQEGYRLRYSDSFILDAHQILFKKGGIYSSPKTKTFPNGELELVFEAYPVAFFFELVGGEAIDGQRRILDISLEELHQTTPIYFGSKYEIHKVKEFFNRKERKQT